MHVDTVGFTCAHMVKFHADDVSTCKFADLQLTAAHFYLL